MPESDPADAPRERTAPAQGGIDRRRFLEYAAAGGLSSRFAPSPLAALLGAPPAARAAVQRVDAHPLARVFAHPPASASPGAYWYWLGGNVTRAGITADLEAMREAGISNPMLFAIGKSGKERLIDPPADALTPQWWALLEHAVAEAGRLGLTLALNFCDGWATASGPWITPELSMQRVVWSQQTLDGGQAVRGRLPRPPARNDYYREIATLAFPCPPQWDETSFTRQAHIATNLPLKSAAAAAKLTDPDNATELIDADALGARQPGWIDYVFDEPFTLRSITVRTPSPPGYSPGVYRAANSLEVQASDDGKAFQRIGALEYPKHGWQTDLTTLTHAVPQTTSRYFRLVHRPIPLPRYEEEYDFGEDTRLRFFSILLSSEPRIHHLPGKSGEQWAISRRTSAQDIPDGVCVPLQDIIDLTPRLGSDGTLAWDVPPGRWRILRIGYTTTGAQNSAAGGAQGLECDKFSPVAARLQFEKWFGLALERVGPSLAGKVLHVLHVDSWEAGAQNWSPVFRDGFRRLRGYDLLPYIAVLTGVPVVSADTSERVLLDVRRTINDLMQSGFFATVARLAHARGCLFSAEPPNPTFPADGMEDAAQADLPMGEFWLNTPRNDKPTDIKDAVCGSRLYGKTVAGAEAFTEGLMSWDEHPFTFKKLGDHVYCEGINRFMLHMYAQQPWLDRAPGMTLNGIGTFFSRTQTWWKPGKAWFDYLGRCQALLQQGLAVADVCYFTGENLPARALLPRQLSVALPQGYAYDSINRDAILHLSEVQDGCLVLKSGARYRVLVLPDDGLMTPEIAMRLRELVRLGAVILGPPPQRSPSLTLSRTADETVRRLAQELWSGLDGVTHTERPFGAGTVIWGKPLGLVLGRAGLAPDAQFRSRIAPAGDERASADGSSLAAAVEWIHRRGHGWDLYFLSNQSNTPLHLEAAFRIRGRVPELWRPESGETETLGTWREEDGRTVMPLSLDPAGSLFLVFAQPSKDRESVADISGANAEAVHIRARNQSLEALVAQPGSWVLRRRSGQLQALEVADLPPLITLEGPWLLHLTERLQQPVRLTLGTLASWTEQADPAVKYYSGTGTYTTEFTLDAARLPADQLLILDLGEVHELAEVRLNGRGLGVLWKPPFTVDITQAARAGQNSLEVLVTNTWRNRLIGDYAKASAERTTFVVPMLRKGEPWLPGGAGTRLSPAGLLGPVRIRSLKSVTLGNT